MVGIEVFNDKDDFAGPGKGGGYPEGAYAHALDKGWHVGAIGAEDLGHRRTDDWGGPGWAKTVILANGRSEWAIKAAMQARRFYAVRTPSVRLTFTVDGRPMGSRIAPTEGQALTVKASVNDPHGQARAGHELRRGRGERDQEALRDAARHARPSAGTSCAPRAPASRSRTRARCG